MLCKSRSSFSLFRSPCFFWDYNNVFFYTGTDLLYFRQKIFCLVSGYR